MGYDTQTYGEIEISPVITSEHEVEFLAYLESEGEDCPWVLGQKTLYIESDLPGDFTEWLDALRTKFFAPRGYTLRGAIDYRGEDWDDHGTVYVDGDRMEAVADVNPGPSWKRDDTAERECGRLKAVILEILALVEREGRDTGNGDAFSCARALVAQEGGAP